MGENCARTGGREIPSNRKLEFQLLPGGAANEKRNWCVKENSRAPLFQHEWCVPTLKEKWKVGEDTAP